MWRLGLIHLPFLFHRSTNTSGGRAMKKRMQALGVVPGPTFTPLVDSLNLLPST